MKQFELGQYKGLNLESFDVSVKEDEMKEAMNGILKSLDEVRVEKRNEPIETGDSVIVNIVGTETGMPYPKVKEDGLQFKVGDENVLPEFSAKLLGQKMGDTVVFDTTIQPVLIEFQALWGYEITFSIEIVKVFTIKKPELTDENIHEIEPKVKTLQGFKKMLKNKILQEKRARAHVANMSKVMGAVAENCKYEFDQEILDQAAEDLYQDYTRELKNVFNMELVVYLMQRKMSSDELLAECKEEAARRILGEKILDAVIQAEGIQVTVNEHPADLTNDIGVLENEYLRKKAMEFLVNANLIK
ncbi:trigger factor [Dehalobacter sp.]|uniref:trigger factor n=1 Tax=Dehalobacter sp. TaxID=1962289 RepID=UPI00258EB06E|nr:trigger factor [Dehalobacter sp.]MDJ0304885.1 trigger factor [Dehalobacter sp.]